MLFFLDFFVKFASLQACLTLISGFIPAFFTSFNDLG